MIELSKRRSVRGDTETGCVVGLAALAFLAYVGWQFLDGAMVMGVFMMGRNCPFGAELAGAHPPTGTTEWCQRKNDRGDYVKYGPFHVWTEDGKLIDSGYYSASGTLNRDSGMPRRLP